MTKCRFRIPNVAMVLVIIFVVMFSIATASCAPAKKTSPSENLKNTSADKDSKESLESKNSKLMPVDEASKNEDFKNFRDKMLIAVKNRDLEFIKEHLDMNIKNSFGGDGGEEEFLEQWQLNVNPEKSSFWYELGQVLQLGGTFLNKEKSAFIAPYVFSAFPNNYDAFTYGVIVDKDINLRLKPSINSKTVAKLNYDIVEVIDSGQDESGWRKIRLENGTKGYVAKKHFRSPIDYRCEFEKSKVDGIWRLTFFVAGD